MKQNHSDIRSELRDTLGNWHPLGRWTSLYTIIPAIVTLGVAAQHLGILAGLLIGAALAAAIEFGMRRWAWRKAAL